MRVLHIGTELSWRGGENQIRLLVEGLKSQGIENHAAYPAGSAGLERLGQIAPTLGLTGRRGFDPRNVWRILQYCQKHKIDLIDAHSANAHALGLWVKKMGWPGRLVVHRRVDNVIRKRWWTQKKYLSPQVDHFVAISAAIGKMLSDYGVAASKISVVPSAVEEGPYKNLNRQQISKAWREQWKISPQTLLIGNASALTDQKGYEYLLDSLAELKASGRLFQAFIAGEGYLREPLERQSRQLGLTDQVQFLGFIKNVPEFLSALDILAVPSRNEGLATLILDGIHAGCAVTAAAVGGIPEMIVDGKTGLLMRPHDVSHLTENLIKLYDSESLRRELNSQAKEHIRRHFSLENMVNGNRRVYTELISLTRGRAHEISV